MPIRLCIFFLDFEYERQYHGPAFDGVREVLPKGGLDLLANCVYTVFGFRGQVLHHLQELLLLELGDLLVEHFPMVLRPVLEVVHHLQEVLLVVEGRLLAEPVLVLTFFLFSEIEGVLEELILELVLDFSIASTQIKIKIMSFEIEVKKCFRIKNSKI